MKSKPDIYDMATWLLKKRDGILSLAGMQATNVFIAILTLPIILANLPIADYGKWQFLLALQAWGISLSAPQITEGAKRGMVRGQDGTFFFALFKRARLLAMVSLCFILLGLFFARTDRAIFSLLSFSSAFYLFTNILLQSSIGEVFIAKKMFTRYAVWSILTSPVARIGSALIAWFTHSIIIFVLFQIAFAGVASLWVLITLVKKFSLWQMYKRHDYDQSSLTFGLRSIPIDVSGAVSNRLIEVLIGSFFGLTNLAYFSVARDLRNQLANGMKLIFPLLYADFARQPIEALIKIFFKRLPGMIALSTLLGAAGTLGGILYITIFLPTEFHAAIPLLVILALAFPIGIPTIIPAMILQAHLRYRAIAFATIVPNLIEVMLILSLGWFFGIMGMTSAIAMFGYISFIFFYFATVHRDSLKKFLEKSKLIRRIMAAY
ncbi:hypothetical protein FJZ48_03175 [Candidatus Uhrbacteria bacterium]|nr:hypothetical protein [Candidatus Uhrbacteria bacterium]